MKKFKFLLLAFAMIAGGAVSAQVAINNDNSAPDGSAMLDVKSSNQGFLPPRMSNNERDNILAPAAGLMIFNTEENSVQLFNGTVWENLIGSPCAVPEAPGTVTGSNQVDENATGESYSIASVPGATSYHWTVPSDATVASGQGSTSITVDFAESSGNVSVRAEGGCGNSSYTNLTVVVGTPTLAIGDFHEGGVVFWLDGIGGGLICAVNDQDGGSGMQWYNGSYIVTGATGTAIGTGQANTTTIINEQGAGTYAATVCTAVGAGWFLPSKDELNEMYLNRVVINATATANGGTVFSTTTLYWSSSEDNSLNAWHQAFEGFGQYAYYKYYPDRVRAVRAF